MEVAADGSGEEAIKAKLFPGQEAFRREEQRRFEILQAHWNVPIEDMDLDRKALAGLQRRSGRLAC